MVSVSEGTDQLEIRQNRFLSTGDAKAEEDLTTWWIPLGMKSGPELTAENPRALISSTDTIRGIGKDSFYKINKDLSGFYRTNYSPDRLKRLGQSLELLSTEDKIGMIGDAAALAVSGEGSTAALLSLLQGFKDENNYLSVACSFFSEIRISWLLTYFIECGLKSRPQSAIFGLYSRRMKL